jgi:Na+/H+ antiporter NhaA
MKEILKSNWKSIVLIGLFFSINLLPYWLQLAIIVTNLLAFFTSSFILIRKANLKHYNNQKNIVSDFMEKSGVLAICAIVFFGLFIAIYDLYVFWKSPLKKEFDSIQQQTRNNNLRKLGI